MSLCKSKTHANYSAALEGLYIQTWMAHRDLSALVGPDAPAGHRDALDKGRALHLNSEDKLTEVVERITFGRSELAAAEAAVDKHLRRGCRNIDK